MQGVNLAVLGSAGRYVLSFVLGLLAAHGLITAGQASSLDTALQVAVPAVLQVGILVYGAIKHTDNAKLVAADKIMQDPAKVEAADPKVLANVISTAAAVPPPDPMVKL